MLLNTTVRRIVHSLVGGLACPNMFGGHATEPTSHKSGKAFYNSSCIVATCVIRFRFGPYLVQIQDISLLHSI